MRQLFMMMRFRHLDGERAKHGLTSQTAMFWAHLGLGIFI